MRDEHPVELRVELPAGAPLDGPAVRGHLEDELRTRAEVVAAGDSDVVVRAYRREEVEAIADELVAKLSDLGLSSGTEVHFVTESGPAVRSVD